MGPVVNSQVQPVNTVFAVFCHSLSGTPPLFFEWFKDGKSIRTNRDSRVEVENSKLFSTLNIAKISRNDAGNYSCKVKNAFGSDTLNVVLNVKGNFKCPTN